MRYGFLLFAGGCYARSELAGLAPALGLWVAMFGSPYSNVPYSGVGILHCMISISRLPVPTNSEEIGVIPHVQMKSARDDAPSDVEEENDIDESIDERSGRCESALYAFDD